MDDEASHINELPPKPRFDVGCTALGDKNLAQADRAS